MPEPAPALETMTSAIGCSDLQDFLLNIDLSCDRLQLDIRGLDCVQLKLWLRGPLTDCELPVVLVFSSALLQVNYPETNRFFHT
jgi:hypothetical protein